MGDIGLLLSLPTESIAVRVALASLMAVVLVRLLAMAGIRAAHTRAAMALVPGVACVIVIIMYATSPELPSVWHTVDSTGSLTVPVRDTYLSFSPSALPLLLGLWAAIATVRVGIRLDRHRRSSRLARRLLELAGPPPASVADATEDLASRLRVNPPRVALVPDLAGGAVVVGLRAPLLLLDERLVATLDDQELVGVLAHELAHVRRRDNLLGFAWCLMRDALFFVPGGKWSVRTLLREREYAADTVAVGLTSRPGALASGLLKVLEARPEVPVAACSSLLGEGTLVARVEALCDDRPPPTLGRRLVEVSAVAGVTVAAVLAAVVVPGLVAGPGHERDALGVLLSDVPPATDAPGRSVVFRSFATSVGATIDATSSSERFTGPGERLLVGDDDAMAGVVGLESCRRGLGSCGEERGARVSLPGGPTVRVDDELVAHWRLDPIVRSGDGESALFWFERVSER